jgi:hypothetical protein
MTAARDLKERLEGRHPQRRRPFLFSERHLESARTDAVRTGDKSVAATGGVLFGSVPGLEFCGARLVSPLLGLAGICFRREVDLN